jgi:peptide/bleomycin uptake transporter
LSRDSSTRARAWAGLAVFLAHIFYKNFVRFRLNAWFDEFYTLAQSASSEEVDEERDRVGRSEVDRLLLRFVLLVTPNVVVHPVFATAKNFWAFDWRRSLLHAYMQKWRVRRSEGPVEGAAQRLHEDCRLFVLSIAGIVSSFLDASVTLCVFLPILRAPLPDSNGTPTLPRFDSRAEPSRRAPGTIWARYRLSRDSTDLGSS